MATVTLLDGAGQAVTEGAAVYASGATGQAAPKTSKSGSTTQTLLLGEGTFETMVVGWPTDADATGLAPAQLLAWAPGASLPADGTTTTPLVVVAVDRFGQGARSRDRLQNRRTQHRLGHLCDHHEQCRGGCRRLPRWSSLWTGTRIGTKQRGWNQTP